MEEALRMNRVQPKPSMPLTNGYVCAAIDALGRMENTALTADAPDAKTVDEWYSEYRKCNSVFRRWCEINLRTSTDGVVEVGEVFGAAAILLNADNMEISWPLWFSYRCSSFAAKEHGCPLAVVDIVGQLKSQINLISEYKLDQMGNPGLFPPAVEILQKLSYTADDSMTFEAMDKADKVFQRLENEWVSDGDTHQILETLLTSAAIAKSRCSYDPKHIFKIFRSEVYRWAKINCEEELLKIVVEDGSFDAAVDKLSMEMMLWQEKEMVSAIAQASKTGETSKPAFSKDRLVQLAAGATTKP